MREERKREETKMLQALRGYGDLYEEDENELEEQTDIEQSNDENEEEVSPKLQKIKKIIIIFLIIIFGILFYINFIEIKFLKINEYKIESNKIPETFDGLKIVHFSDIHYGTTINEKELEKVVNKINDLNPDIVIFTGDLFDKNIKINEDTQKTITEALSKIETRLYKYAIIGNEDTSNENYSLIMKDSNFIILNNESTLIYDNNNTPIMITGFNTNEEVNYTILTNFIDEIDTTNLYKIVLTHQPDNTDNFLSYNPDLILAGHSLGGLIKIPFIKPLFLQDGAKTYYNDSYNLNNSQLFISNGLGTSGLNARFNNLPSINLYRLYKTNSTS